MAEKDVPLWQRTLNRAIGAAGGAIDKVAGFRPPSGALHPSILSPARGNVLDPQANPPRRPGSLVREESRIAALPPGERTEELRVIAEAEEAASMRRSRNISENIRRQGIPDTRPDVFPQPFTDEQQALFDEFRKEKLREGFTEQQIRDEVYRITLERTGAPTVVLPPGFESVLPEDMDPRDPFRNPRLLGAGSPFAGDPKAPITDLLVRQSLGRLR